jgi:hypothetical protein
MFLMFLLYILESTCQLKFDFKVLNKNLKSISWVHEKAKKMQMISQEVTKENGEIVLPIDKNKFVTLEVTSVLRIWIR